MDTKYLREDEREIGQQCDKATDGPWMTRTVPADLPSGKWFEAYHIIDKMKWSLFGSEPVGGKQWRHDVEFAAAARTDVPLLLSRLCECRKQVEELQRSQRTFAVNYVEELAARTEDASGRAWLLARAAELKAKE